uniref:NADH dehydrogenase subunit 6 n=1 Tax=Nanostrea pinnicola TaxID=2933268 RepID=A0A9Y1CML3_9BIVA|nr:NADH dehydrogenase subunit 6 [Nanostrea pinnicola]UOU85772.1 NADH dehydrogenase subunit 6 [Nanostrea pinnicola]
MKLIVCMILSFLVICSVYPVPLFFLSVLLSLCMLAEIGANFSDFLAMLAFMVYISGIMGVIGYFITFFPKKFETSGQEWCSYSLLYMISLIAFSLWAFSSYYPGSSIHSVWSSEASATFSGEAVLFLAPILLIVMVAVVVMSKPELKTVRRWVWSKS